MLEASFGALQSLLRAVRTALGSFVLFVYPVSRVAHVNIFDHRQWAVTSTARRQEDE